MSDYTQLLKEVSVYITKTARELFHEGAGQHIFPVDELDLEDDTPGVIDYLPEDSEQFVWANAVLGFLRFINAVHQNALNPDAFLLANEEIRDDE